MADDPIERVVLLMLENRSFDHILGGTQKMLARWPLNGITQYNGNIYRQIPGAARQIANDPEHETTDVLIQLGAGGSVPQNGGFVLNYAQHYPQLADPSEAMRFRTR
jgi:hypothetical protein